MWLPFTLFGLIRSELGALQELVELRQTLHPEHRPPPVVFHPFSVEWNWTRSGSVQGPLSAFRGPESLQHVDHFMDDRRERHVLGTLTHDFAWLTDGNGHRPLPPVDLVEALDRLPRERREEALGHFSALLPAIYRPFVLGPDAAELFPMDEAAVREALAAPVMVNVAQRLHEVDRVQRELNRLPLDFEWPTTEGPPCRGCAALVFSPLVVDARKRKAYYPVAAELLLGRDSGELDATHANDRALYWEALWKVLDEPLAAGQLGLALASHPDGKNPRLTEWRRLSALEHLADSLGLSSSQDPYARAKALLVKAHDIRAAHGPGLTPRAMLEMMKRPRSGLATAVEDASRDPSEAREEDRERKWRKRKRVAPGFLPRPREGGSLAEAGLRLAVVPDVSPGAILLHEQERAAVRRLSPILRETWELDQQGLSRAEIAARLGIKVGTVYTRLSRVRAAIKASL